MAIRQYIGARYVPRFMGTYDASQQYEVLDVVDNGGGTTYILKKPAPVGTPVTNTTYWALYGATSGAIINLQNQIDTINSEIDDINDTINRTFIVIGDSYAEGWTPEGTNTGWATLLQGMLGVDNNHYYHNELGGSGFHSSLTFLSLLQAVTVSDPDAVTDIVVAGGHNDAVSNTGVESNIVTFVDYCKLTYPNAKIWCGMIAYDAQRNNTYSATVQQLNDAKEKYQTITKYGGIYMGGSELVVHDGNLLSPSDGIHPTADGQYKIAQFISSCLKGSNYDTTFKMIYAPVANSAASETMQSSQWLHNGVVTLNLAGNLVLTTPISNYQAAGNDPNGITLGTLPKRYINGNAEMSLGIMHALLLDTLTGGGSKFYHGIGVVTLKPTTNNLMFYPVLLNDTGSGYRTLDNLKAVRTNFYSSFEIAADNC